MVFFSLISTAFSSLFYGSIVTAVIMVLLYAVLKAVSRSIVQTPVFYVTGVVLAVLLLVQTSLMIGAIQAKSTLDAAEIYLTQLLEDTSGAVSAQDSQHILDALTDEIPIIGSFIDVANFSGQEVEDLPAAMCTTMRDDLSSYIWRRVWWTLGIIAVACVLVIFFDKPGAAQTRRASSDRHDRHRSPGGNHQRVSRRRR